MTSENVEKDAKNNFLNVSYRFQYLSFEMQRVIMFKFLNLNLKILCPKNKN